MNRVIIPHTAPPSDPAPERSRTVRKAVVPAAGLGTRFLPATKATPKEMVPVVDKPAIQYVVEEAAAAGLDDVLMITGRHKRAIEDHFDHAFELEQALAAKGDPSASVTRCCAPATTSGTSRSPSSWATTSSTRARPCSAGCWRSNDRYEGSVVARMEVPPEQIHLYGCAAVEPSGEEGVVRVTDLVEKPSREDAPSRYAVIGRYVLDPDVFGVLDRTPPGRGGGLQLTDALRDLAAGGTVHGVVFDGLRHDTGDKADYLRTVVRPACDRPDLGPEFTAWLKESVAGLEERGARRDRFAA